MKQALCRKILTGWMGYTIHVTEPQPAKYVIALAPHTSNWDFVIGLLYSRAMGFKCRFMMKKFWFFWPLGYLMRALGGIPVERSKKMSLTDQMAQQALEHEEFHLCITPEGMPESEAMRPETASGNIRRAIREAITGIYKQ